ncbi:diguanylate cyclase (GGDEF) domain-containing protein [Kosakonia radicincitans]|uniref:diguanylate cyclase n=2 Tax=Kosakonia radicincitans TaxID=283686 RepID=A0AAX2F0E7_9ENTR|nr:diguanylate cyclase (GGDEF) domain-containing protein [Kosakonia radicincitans]SFR27386.1 diguanylate cyclase (GGDEF) domain-containing protein [Kosakonia radicincitans]SFU18747.1 diguanylate cyclase (GGDEF) domain-containing protein [Kosakonia radicincitans]SFY36157.1 diguanylate cyclase (GGDEF) domain-containing protein [Kosakonia radicincitans]
MLKDMKIHSRQLSFTAPILVSFIGIFAGFVMIAILVIFSQHKEMLEQYQDINRNFTHNLAVNHAQSILRENDYILNRAALFLAQGNNLDETVNGDREQGLQLMMKLLALMPTVSSISLADSQGRYLRAPQVIAGSVSDSFDASTRPWFMHQAESSMFNHYTDTYTDYFTHNPTVSLYKPVISLDGKLKGTLAFHLDLVSMSFTLRTMQAPMQGEFFVVDREGKAMLHPDTSSLFKAFISPLLLAAMTGGEGSVYDEKSATWYYYYAFTNPDWLAIYKVHDSTLNNLTRHATMIVGWGFGTAAVVIILFGLYLRHASRTVLINIINAINTGDVKRAPKLEAMLSKAIKSNKEREQSWVRQATIDALTNCKNRRAFDADIASLMNDHQPFSLALVDIDNFKSINDTWGHLSGDIVLRNVAREGLKVMQPHGISLYRYGGEEFAVIFPETHIENSQDYLEEWRSNVANRGWREDGLIVTFSAGLGEWHMESLEQLVTGVDEALYQAKQQGKNRILLTNAN